MEKLKEILSKYEKKKNKAEENALKKKKEIYLKFPEIENIDREIIKIYREKIKNKILFNMSKKNTKNNLENNLEKNLGENLEENINNNILEIKKEDKEKEIKEKIKKLEERKKEIFIKNNINIEEITPNYDCKFCKDTGFIEEKGLRKKCNCLIQEMIKMNYDISNIDNGDDKTFENFDLKYYQKNSENINQDSKEKNRYENINKIILYLKKYVEKFESLLKKEKIDLERNLIFIGKTGVGKTHLSEAVGREILKKGYTVWYQISVNLFSKLMEYKLNDITKYNKMLEYINNIELLIIDDLGAENITESRKEELFSLLNYRIHNKKPIIISTNLDLNDIKRVYSERISSRIIGEFQIIKIDGDDIRLRKKIEKINEKVN